MKPSSADHSVSPPRIDIPRDYNAAVDLLERNLQAGRALKTAYIDDAGDYSFGELAERANRFGGALLALGLMPEQRVMLALLDTIDWPTAFLGAIKAGIVPVAVSTLLGPREYEFMLADSRVRALIVSEALLPQFAPLLGKLPCLEHVIVSGADSHGQISFEQLLRTGPPELGPAATTRDDACFWLYSSGSTGAPKGTVHAHASLISTAELYARPVLRLTPDDVVFSASKLFFAYGLGNALTFPLATGATTLLMAERASPRAVFQRWLERGVTLFFAAPTAYAAMLADRDFPARERLALRQCGSAGEPLPPDIGRRFRERTGVDILDGIGSTEMLHIFISNRPGDVRLGTTGTAIPGYQLRIVDDQGNPVPPGELGELQVDGPTAAIHYWNDRDKTRGTFLGRWTRSGDKYRQDADGYYVYGGRSDDMLKVSGMYVSPVEIEAALIAHEAVLEAAVVGAPDENQLIKPKAFVVLQSGRSASPELARALQQHVKERLPAYKYPRWIEFIEELPKTGTGKIQRFKLRA